MLDRILDQSESYRKKVAFLLTFIVGVAIFSAWLVIAGFNVQKSSALRDDPNDETKAAQQFKNSLPTLSQEQEVKTELSKQNAAKASDAAVEEDKKSIFDKFFGSE